MERRDVVVPDPRPSPEPPSPTHDSTSLPDTPTPTSDEPTYDTSVLISLVRVPKGTGRVRDRMERVQYGVPA